MMSAIDSHGARAGVQPLCAALGVARETYYRRRRQRKPCVTTRPRPLRALSESERRDVIDLLHSERFVDRAPAEVVATLLDPYDVPYFGW